MKDQTLEAELKLIKNPKFVLYKGKKSKPLLIAQALRALVMSLRAGKSEAAALEIVGTEFGKYEVGKSFLRASRLMYDQGVSFKAALISTEVLPATAAELVEASTTSQTLQTNLQQAAKLVTEGHNVRKMLTTSLAGPGMMFVLVLVFLFLSTSLIIPKFMESYAMLGSEVPKASLIMMDVSEVVTWVLVAIGSAGLLTGIYWFAFGRRHRGTKMLKDLIVLKIPGVGPILKLTTTARLFRLLAANLDTGVSEVEALRSAGRGCGNFYVEQHCDAHAQKMITEGAPMKEYISNKAFPYTATAMISSAPSVLQEISAMEQLIPDYEEEVQLQLKTLQETVVPILNYVVYAIAGVLIIALMVPMYSIYEPMMNMV